jgi:hypothetical protein
MKRTRNIQKMKELRGQRAMEAMEETNPTRGTEILKMEEMTNHLSLQEQSSGNKIQKKVPDSQS